MRRGTSLFVRLVRRVALLAVVGPATTLGCAHTVIVSQSLADMDRTRVAPAVVESAPLAPQEYALAEAERAEAEAAMNAGDRAAGDLHAARAKVAYERVVTLALLARATDQAEAAKVALATHAADAAKLAGARVDFERAADVAATEIAVAREALAPARMGAADPTREAARLAVARSMAAEGRLLCSAARLLVAPRPQGSKPDPDDVARLDRATALVDAAAASHAGDAKGASRGAALIEASSKARAACLDALTHVRRGAGEPSGGEADTLLSALSARGGLSPSRDERGVFVTLRGPWNGVSPGADAQRELAELGRVAANQPGSPVQVVVYDATEPTAAGRARDLQRGQAVLAAMGAVPAATVVETAGADLPITDPADPKTRERNARVEVVFVSRTE